jgi:hypothetical protein
MMSSRTTIRDGVTVFPAKAQRRKENLLCLFPLRLCAFAGKQNLFM